MPFSHRKPAHFIGDSKDVLSSFPDEVKIPMGYAIHEAQLGDKSPIAKPLKSFPGSGVIEICEDFDGNTYRAIYTTKLAGVIYVLHAFQKKSKKGISTPRSEIDLIEKRFKAAQEYHAENY